MGDHIEPWEPEECVGKLWHAFASRLDAPVEHADAAVGLDEVAGRLAVLFRGLGGDPAVEIRPAAVAASRHRVSLRRRLGTPEERVARAAFDGAALRLPPVIAAFPDRAANGKLYSGSPPPRSAPRRRRRPIPTRCAPTSRRCAPPTR